MRFFLLLFSVFSLIACEKEIVDPSDELYISIEDLAFLGGDYQGTLTYLQYESDELNTLDVKAEYYTKKNALKYTHFVDEGNGEVEKRRGSFSVKNGTINGAPLTKKELDGVNNTFLLIYEEQARDDGKKATIRFTISGNQTAFSIKKEVRFDGTSDFFLRNRFDFTKT
ncbi:MAG: hypothetical protein AAF847_01280 [Bacteroidota bacterium]